MHRNAPDSFTAFRELSADMQPDRLDVGGRTLVCAWEEPFMAALAEGLAPSGADVLEIGFGLGLAARAVQAGKPRSHYVLEPHPAVFREALAWADSTKAIITVVEDFWQRAQNRLGMYDAILYDPSGLPGAEEEVLDFLDLAVDNLLRPGGRAGFRLRRPTLPEAWQERILARYDRLDLRAVRGLPQAPAIQLAAVAHKG